MLQRPLPYLLAAALIAAGAASAQEPGTTVTVAAGPELEASGLHTTVLGTAYRDLWTTPIEVPVLDLEREAGGLEPQFVVGRLQTLGLALAGADGRSYTFRAVHKELVRALPEELRDTPIGDIAQDLLSAAVPAGSVVATPIAQAAGVRQTPVRLVVMPDHPALGEFREQFAGMLGTLSEFPTGAEDGGTFGATEIVDGDDMFRLITADPEVYVDAREFLRVRLVDMLLGDWDRHVGQWRFARIPGEEGLQPIPEDRDQAFAQYEGIAMMMARDKEPKFSDYEAEYQGLEGLGWNARSLDRRLLTGLERQDWVAMAEEIQSRLTDEVIEAAVGAMPEPHVELEGETLVGKIIARRDGLVDIAQRQYEFLAEQVNVFSTDGSEVVRIERLAAGTTRIRIAPRTGSEPLTCEDVPAGAAYFSRDFRPHETRDVRLFTGAGDDQVIYQGFSHSGPRVHVVGGGGQNLFCAPEHGTQVAFDMSSADDSGPGPEVAPGVRLAPSETIASAGTPEESQGRALDAERDWGSTSYRLPVFGYGPDIGPVLGYGVVLEKYGFRKRPFAQQHQIRGAVAFGALSARVDYTGIYRRENRRQFFVVRAIASGIESLRYYGFGNDTEEFADNDFFRFQQTLLAAEGRAAFWAGKSATFTAGGVVRWTHTQEEPGEDFISEDRPYGIEDVTQAGVVAGFNFNNHTRPDRRELKGSDDALRFGPPALGVGYTLDLDAYYYPNIGGALRGDYGYVRGEATASYLLGDSGPALLFGVGGQTNWGDTPYYDAAYVGSDQVRGLRPNRFAGEHSLYGNAAAFFYLGRLNLILPGRWGVLARGGVGRVWQPGEDSDTWHPGYGGGLWWAPWDVSNAFRVEVSRSDESTLVYFLLGFGF